jgi:two-component SAPR family response regulator
MASFLVLDDERIVKNFVTLLLRRDHHVVRQAGTAEEAEQICHDTCIDLLIADVKLADGRSGTDFALRLVGSQPKIKCLFISGLPIENWSQRDQLNVQDMPERSYAIVSKPFSPDILLKTIDEFLRAD